MYKKGMVLMVFLLIVAAEVVLGGNAGIERKPERGVFSVSVPISLPIEVDSRGNVTTATDLVVENNSEWVMDIKEVKATPHQGWSLGVYGKDYRKERVGLKEIGLRINGEEVKKDGSVELAAGSWGGVEAGGVIPLRYEATLGVQKERIEGIKVASIDIIVGWREEPDKTEPEKLDKTEPEKLDKTEPEKLDKTEPEKLDKTEPEKLDKTEPEKLDKTEPEKLDKTEPEKLDKTEPEKEEPKKVETEDKEEQKEEQEPIEAELE